jgi:FkbM family methyltransferase
MGPSWRDDERNLQVASWGPSRSAALGSPGLKQRGDVVSWRTSKPVLILRDLGRRLGINRRVASLVHGGGYEIKYDREFSANLRAGDCVWDIGANIGRYTQSFAERIGQTGQVVAFEPSPANWARLVERCALLGNVETIRCGLGRTDGTLSFRQGGDELGATTRVADEGLGEFVVDVRSGDSLLVEGSVGSPNAIKIDVEGFEVEVLEGMAKVLHQPGLRVIGIEVHFGILKERGFGQAPRQMEDVLRAAGFTISWPDSSHILAARKQ